MRLTISHHVFANGLRAVHIYRTGSSVAYCGLSIRAGSADENPDKGFPYGTAHFVEHCIFKGTETRTVEVLRNAMESVGGELNAYTDKDNTVVYAVSPRRYARRALTLIADITRNSVFPTQELDKERDVVEAEIDSYKDTPSEQVFDDFEDLLLRDTPLGHNILGTRKDLRRIKREHCLRWLREKYVPGNCVLFYSGAMRREKFLTLASQVFGCGEPVENTDKYITDVNDRKIKVFAPVFTEVRHRAGHQSHTVMGKALPVEPIENIAALQLLSNILGGPGMNSLLNVEMREKRGLVYTVETSLICYAQATVFNVYFGCEEEHVAECKDIVRKTIEKLANEPLTDRGIAAARRQFLGQSAIAAENAENQATAIARAILIRGKALTRAESLHIFNSLTSESLCRAARQLLPLSSLTFSPRACNH